MFLINLKLKKSVSIQLKNYLDKGILEIGGILKSVLDCYKNQETCNEEVDNYPHALELVPECYKIKKICDKAVKTYLYNKICS